MKIIALVIWLIVSFVPGFIGSMFTSPSIPVWYASLNKPWFTPPGAFIGFAWTILYLLMGTAAYFVWEKGYQNNAVKFALTIFIIQLILNGLWSYIFFGQHLILAAFIEIIILWLFILWVIILFFPISSIAGWLLIPYILWVSFASFLNFTVWMLNR